MWCKIISSIKYKSEDAQKIVQEIQRAIGFLQTPSLDNLASLKNLKCVFSTKAINKFPSAPLDYQKDRTKVEPLLSMLLYLLQSNFSVGFDAKKEAPILTDAANTYLNTSIGVKIVLDILSETVKSKLNPSDL